MKVNRNQLIYLFLLLQPIIDLITSVMTKFEVGFISLGVIVRGLFILIMLIYLLFFCNTKYKRLSIFYVFLLGLYGIIYFGIKPELFHNSIFLVNDFIYLFKYMYFLILFITMFNFYFQYELDYRKIIKIFIIDLLMYVFFILFPFITNTSFSSYAENRGEGIVGWFYAANDISNIFVLLFPMLILSLDKKIDLFKIISIFLIIISVLLIGTKVAYFGIVLTLLLYIFYCLFSWRKSWKKILLIILILIVTFVSGSNSYVIENIRNRIDKYKEFEETGTNVVEDENDIIVREEDTVATIVIFSSRDRLWRQTFDVYKNRNISEKLFGIGFSNRQSINDISIEKLVEMDIFDILFHGGIVLFILYFLPYLFIIIYFIKYVIKNSFRIELRGWMLGYLVILGFMSSTISGHLFSSPSVLIYYTFIVILFLEYFKTEKNIKKKKISFLMLHLGNGGIERATVNTANALSKEYDVELAVAYKLSDEIMYDIDKHIKINYLIDSDIAVRMTKYKELLKKHEFKEFISSVYEDYFKTRKIYKFVGDFSEGIKVLALRKELMIKYLKKCDSDIIISTRVEYSTLLSKYGNGNSVKIAVEHRHHNNDKKYIKKIRNEYDNINYLVVLTEGLRRDYFGFLKRDSKTEVVCIPNMIVNYPAKLSDLKNKKVISIGRIVPGKRVDEIVAIAEHFPKWEFEIIGDGDKFESIKELIMEKNLDNVKLLGSMKNEDALRHLQEASIFIMTSETEGLPMVLLEAYSYGIPVVAYRTDSGVCDIVDNGVNGYVIDNRDQDLMIEKLNDLMDNATKRKSFGNKAHQKSLLFSEKEIVKKWLEIL